LQTLENRLELKAAGLSLFDERMEPFKEACKTAAEQCLGLDSTNFEGAEIKSKVASASAAVNRGQHQVLQVCTWSVTPLYHRKCIICAVDVLIPICVFAARACELQGADEKSAFLDPRLRAAFESIAIEENNIMLRDLVGQDILSKFLKRALEWQSVAVTAHGNYTGKTIEKINSETAKLSEKLINEENKASSWVDFAKLFSAKTAKAIKDHRLVLKDLLSGLSTEDQAKLEETTAIITKAKFQSFKWGLSKYISHEHIKFATAEGQTLRKGLADIWNVNSKDKSFLKYLGDQSVKEVEQTVDLNRKMVPSTVDAAEAAKVPNEKGQKRKAGAADSSSGSAAIKKLRAK
jgi:hypothetical protein